MSWIEKLYKTYDQCVEASLDTEYPLLPLFHAAQQAHVELVIDNKGNFLSAQIIDSVVTVVPATVKSMTGRTSGIAPHALSDKIEYCSKDSTKIRGHDSEYNAAYRSQLRDWCTSSNSHPKAKAVLDYVEKGSLVDDLVRQKILLLDEQGMLVTRIAKTSEEPGVWRKLPKKKVDGSETLVDINQSAAFIRWVVETTGDPMAATWKDQGLAKAWIQYCSQQEGTHKGLCMVTGLETVVTDKHLNRIRHGGDNAKLISSDDKSGFTYRGRFTNADQACSIGLETSMKAHNALRWLVSTERKQAFRNGDQVIVTWAVKGTEVPDPLESTFALLGLEETEGRLEDLYHSDAGQLVGQRFSKRMAGYQAALGQLDEVVVMGIDSATPGRMAITYYRELHGSELLQRVERWHEKVNWYQNYSKTIKFIGAPSPRDIAEAAYGRRLDDKLKKATVDRLLPCIIDAQPIPRDLVDSVVRRVANRVGMEHWEWAKCLGIACALYRGTHENEHFKLTLDMERDTRDYLYGRLLAIAEDIENCALRAAKEKPRDTSAEKLMHRFASRPYSTWTQIELNLRPYMSRLKSKWPGVHRNRLRLLSDVTARIGDRFTDDSRLSGEYLLGYHCQWLELNPPKEKGPEQEELELNEQTEQTTNP